MEDGSVISDLEPSIPRTPAQAVLRIVSILMGVIGAVALVGGVIVLAANVMGRLPGGDIWTVATFGVMIVVASGLLLLTAVLGIMASNNSARVEPYRFLCYLVGLAVLVAIVWGWGMGTFILFNPIVLTTTIVYVLVCSRLADKVKEEHDKGVKGETFLRSRHQRVLHLLSDIIILKGVITLVVYGEGERAVISGVPVTVSGQVFALLVTGGLASGLNVLAGCLGIRGANRPQKVVPFLVIAALSVAMDLVQVVGALIGRGVMGVAFDVLLDLLFMGSCLDLAVRVMRQPTPEELAAAAGVALVPDDEA